MSKDKGKSILLFSAKGGVGKTTIALNLAGVFCMLEKKVLIIDFDIAGGGIATYLNKSFDKDIYNLSDDLVNNRFKDFENYVTQYNEHIDFIASSKDPRRGSKITPQSIETILEKACLAYDIVIVDSNHMLNEFNVTLLDAANLTLFVLTNDLLDLKNSRNVIKIFNDAKKDNYKVLLNEATSPFNKYYSLYEVKNMIKHNIDYKIGSEIYLKTFASYVSDGKIITLDNRFVKCYPKAWKTYNAICKELTEENDEK